MCKAMIELAPRHKSGLAVESPILLGAGAAGLGDALPPGVDSKNFGAVIVGPITRSGRTGTAPPRLGVVNGGMVLQSGGQNRGAHAVRRKLSRSWARLKCPIIAQLTDEEPGEIRQAAGALRRLPNLAGFELSGSHLRNPDLLGELVGAVRDSVDLPLCVQLTRANRGVSVEAAVGAGADALVLCHPESGAAINEGGQAVRGPLFGPLSFGHTLEAVLEVAASSPPVPLIAVGGIHSLDHVQLLLMAGAAAVQLDSLLWVEAGVAVRIAEAGRTLGKHF